MAEQMLAMAIAMAGEARSKMDHGWESTGSVVYWTGDWT